MSPVNRRHKRLAIDLPRLIALYTLEPAKLLNLPCGTLRAGAPADITLIDPGLEWPLDRDASHSRNRNTPFHRWELKGRAVKTFVSGKEVWSV